MSRLSNAERQRRAVEKAKGMMLDAAPRTFELFIEAMEGKGDFKDLPTHTRATLVQKALEYQFGKPAVAQSTKVDKPDGEEEPPDELSLQIV